MANNILLIGGLKLKKGGSHLRGITEELEDRIINKISLFDSAIDRVEIVDITNRDMQPIDLSWIGASVLSKLESIEVVHLKRNYGLVEIDGLLLKNLKFKMKMIMIKMIKKSLEEK
jgi:hypothetical protein